MNAETESAPGASSPDEATPEPTMGRRTFLRGSVAAAAATGATATGGSAAAQGEAYGGWFDDVDNYEGTLDRRGNEEVTVEVGVGENGVLFAPPAILVDPGATVVWEWTGEGGQHNVVHEPEEGDPAFESDLASESGATFERTFDDEAGAIYRYFCSPHRALGMKGAVAVGEVDDELIDPDGGGDDGGSSQSLSLTDLLVAGVGGVVALLLVLAVVRPGGLAPDRQ